MAVRPKKTGKVLSVDHRQQWRRRRRPGHQPETRAAALDQVPEVQGPAVAPEGKRPGPLLGLPGEGACLMTPDQLAVGQVLAGKGSDADKTRKVLAIDTKRREADTEVFRGKVSLGRSTLFLRTLAQWADRDVTPKEAIQ